MCLLPACLQDSVGCQQICWIRLTSLLELVNALMIGSFQLANSLNEEDHDKFFMVIWVFSVKEMSNRGKVSIYHQQNLFSLLWTICLTGYMLDNAKTCLFLLLRLWVIQVW